MKKNLTLLCLLLALGTSAFAQQPAQATVEKSIFNVQTGILGLYVNNEARLGAKFALRTETGLDAGFTINSERTEWALLPVLNLEPRYYYNIEKRAARGRNVSGNAANFLTLSTRLNPGVVVYSSDDVETATWLILVPKWAIRRNIGNSNINYEAGIGIGYYTLLGENRKYYFEKEGVAVDLHVRIGYTF